MFGLTLTKILFTIVVVVAIWRGFRWWKAFAERRDRLAAERAALEPGRSHRGRSARPGDAVELTEACPICQTYVPVEAPVSCGRPDCPYPR